VKKIILLFMMIVLFFMASSGCGKDPCPPFRKAVCGKCGEKSPACRELLKSLERAQTEGRDLNTLCDRGKQVLDKLSVDPCQVVYPTGD